MIRLVVVAYSYEYRAEEVLDTLTRLGREDLADLDDAWYVSRGSDGRVRLHQPIDLPALGDATGAQRDALVGTACLEPLLGGCGGGVPAGLVLGAASVDEQFVIEFGQDAGAGELGDPRADPECRRRPSAGRARALRRHRHADRRRVPGLTSSTT